MNRSSFRLPLILATALLVTTASGATASHRISAAEARQQFAKLPEPVTIMSFEALPARYEGATIQVAVTIDAAGNATQVESATRLPAEVQARILPVVAQWKFSPAQDRDGNAVPMRVILPLRLVEKSSVESRVTS
jgi:hypothetical protein